MNQHGPLPTSQCPSCSYEMDDATLLAGQQGCAEPRAGDLSVCINCGEVLRFNDILVLKPMPIEMFEALDDKFKGVLTCIQDTINKRGRFK